MFKNLLQEKKISIQKAKAFFNMDFWLFEKQIKVRSLPNILFCIRNQNSKI